MGRAFYILMIAQFLSSLADNAIMLISVDILRVIDAPNWVTPLLKFFFVIPYVVLAPWIGSVSDRMYKSHLMVATNGVKTIGCLFLIATLILNHDKWPLILVAYSVIGIGAACYSPAKYGMITELLPEESLVKGNAWMESLTVASIILGSVIGSLLITPRMHSHTIVELVSRTETTHPSVSMATIGTVVLLFVYILSMLFNGALPKTRSSFHCQSNNQKVTFYESLQTLWKDKLGRLSLSITTLFWSVGATLQFLLILWAEESLDFSVAKTAYLQVVFAAGIAVGSVLSSRLINVRNIPKMTIFGSIIGLFACLLVFIHSVAVAVPYLLLLGAMVGFFIVPMNALLQARGALLTGSGQSIAVQNMCENTGILAMIGAYSALLHFSVPIRLIIPLLGLSITAVIVLLAFIQRKTP